MAKKTKKPYKFRQARKDAKAASKGTFEGKKPAGRQGRIKDITAKQTLEDREALKELSEAKKRQRAGKSDFIIDDKGRRVEVRATETPQERMARDRAAARRAAYEKYPLEEGEKKAEPKKKVEASKKFVKKAATKPAGTVGTTKKPDAKGVAKAVEEAKKIQTAKKAPVKKAAVKPTKTFGEISKAVTGATKPAAEKKMTRAERSAANKARWAKMTPAERKNWSATKPGSAKQSAAYKEIAKNTKKFGSTKPLRVVDTPVTKGGELEKKLKAEKAATTKRPTLADLKKNEAKGLKEAKARVAAKNKALADSAKGKTQTPQAVEAKKKAAAKPEGKAKVKKPAAKAPKKFGKTRGLVKGGAALALAGEAVSLVKGSTAKDAAEINRLRKKLAESKGQKAPSALSRAREGAGSAVGQLAALTTMGIVGKTRRQRMDELNKLIKKAGPKELRYGPKGESLVPGTKAYKAGSTTKPKYTASTKKPNTGAGGSTITGTYTVQKGDTLSGIAKNAGVSLSEIRAANPAIMKRKKYKQGNMIWSGTKVRIPKK